MTAGQPRQSIPTVGEVARQFPVWLRTNLRVAITTAVIGGVVGYVANVVLISVHYNGDAKVPSGAPATATGNFFHGALFWGLCSMVMFGMGGYWHAVGTQRFFADLRELPRVLAGLIRGDRGAVVHLMWGAAASMLAALILTPWTGAVLAIGLLASAPRLVGNIFASFLRQVWSTLLKQVAPTRRHAVTGIAGVTVGLLGSALALFVAFFIPWWPVKLILAVVLAGVALLVGSTRPPSTAVMLLFIGATCALMWLTSQAIAFAHDGGWQECSYSGQFWLTCNGTPSVLAHSLIGGTASSLGGLLGGFLGSLSGSLGDGDDGSGDEPPWQPPPGMPPGDRAAINNWIRQLLADPAFQRWRATHPGYSDPPTDAEINAYLGWRHAQGIPDPPLILPSQQGPGPIDAGVPPPPPEDVWRPPTPEPPPDWPPFEFPAGPDAGPPPDMPGPPPDLQPPPDTPAPPPPDPATVPYTEEFRDRIHTLNNALTDPTDPRYQQLDSLLTGIDPARGLTAEQLSTLQQLERQQLAVDAADEQRINDFFAPHREAFEQRVAQLQSEERAWQQQQQDESQAASLLGQIRQLAQQHGCDQILERANDPNFLTGDDGHLNVDNVRGLQAALHNELSIDRAMPPEVNVLEEGTIGTLNTVVDVARSMPVRLVAGALSGGSSEVAYQAIDALEAIHNDVNAAYDKGDRYGQSYSVTDALRTSAGVLASENLPINNVENLVRLARGEDVGVGDFLKGGVMDVLAAMGTEHTAGNISESVNALQYARNPAEVASALHTGENLYKGMVDQLQRIGDMGFGEGQPGGGQGLNAHTAPPGTTLTPNLANQMGIRDPALRQVQAVADRYGAAVEVRETTALGGTEKPIGPSPTEGYQPKAGYVLTKTVNEADGFIGGPGKEHLGEAGFFNPRYNSVTDLPPHEELVQQVRQQYPEYSNERVNAIAKEIPDRLNGRIKELGDAGQGMYSHEGLPREQGGIEVRDGIVYPAGHDKPFVGDHDLYRVQVLDTTGYKVPPAGQPDAPPSEWVTKSVTDLKQQAADAGRNWDPNNPSGMTNSAGQPVGAIPVQEYTNARGAYGGYTKQAIVSDLGQPPYRAQHGAHVDFAGDEPKKFETDLATGGKINIATRDKYLPDNPKGDNLIRVDAGPAPPTLVKDTEWQQQRPAAVQQAFDAYKAAGQTPRDAAGNVVTDPSKWKPPPAVKPPADAPVSAAPEPPMPPGTVGGPRWYGTAGQLEDHDRER